MSLSPLTLNLVEGSVSFSFSPQAARDLQSAIATLMDSLKAVAAKTAGAKASPQKPMEYRYAGDDRLRVTTEAELSRLRDDLAQYIEQVG
jgi:hypothetical protein